MKAVAQTQCLTPFYRYQLGFETTLGGAGERNVPFLFGGQLGTFFRVSNHQFGARLSHYALSPVNIFGGDFCQTINAYYGFTLATRLTSLSIQIGGGYFDSDRYNKNNWHRYNIETSIQFCFTSMGNGLTIRPFYCWNVHQEYLGIAIGAVFGRAWNP